MAELKGSANADKLFELLLTRLGQQGDEFGKEYTITDIANIIPQSSSGIEKYSSYNYAMTSMFGGQKGRDYFIFRNPNLKDTFTELANDNNRNNQTWQNLYLNEKVRINPIYLKLSNDIIPYQEVKSVRILPMSGSDPAFTGSSIEEVQEWFINVLPYREYNFIRGLNSEHGTLVLFQYKAHVIASAVLDERVDFDSELGGVYRGAYWFIPSSIAIFEPLNSQEMKNIWNSFKGFSQTHKKLDLYDYIDFVNSIVNRQIRFAVLDVTEESYQDAIEQTRIDSNVEVNDVPREPVGTTRSGQSERWKRNNITSKKAIVLADYKCEYDESHSFFESKVTGKNYVEAHHLLPMEFQGQFNRSLDVEANIISLCPLCHKTVHHASLEEIEPIIKKLYIKRKSRLQKCEIYIDINKLISYY
jgi:5-methylcytosine-specific restriction enzyme A